ncbi:MAG: plasmid pRiA4b ORF-3 family protein [Steroidobacteraceae bacterium]
MAKRTASVNRRTTWSWQLKIELLDVVPTVWRRIIVPETIQLSQIHQVFQAALGWTNSHLHEFVISGVRYSEPDPDFEDDDEHLDERHVPLQKALGMDARCFDYVYDFGDDWHHVVLIEDQHITMQRSPSIRCEDGENACPPEDVGGALRYADFLAALADPAHEEHAVFREWSGGRFDPRAFDLDAANRALRKIKL